MGRKGGTGALGGFGASHGGLLEDVAWSGAGVAFGKLVDSHGSLLEDGACELDAAAGLADSGRECGKLGACHWVRGCGTLLAGLAEETVELGRYGASHGGR